MFPRKVFFYFIGVFIQNFLKWLLHLNHFNMAYQRTSIVPGTEIVLRRVLPDKLSPQISTFTAAFLLPKKNEHKKVTIYNMFVIKIIQIVTFSYEKAINSYLFI